MAYRNAHDKARARNMTDADRQFANLFDLGLPRREIRAALDLTSSQYDSRRTRLRQLRETAV